VERAGGGLGGDAKRDFYADWASSRRIICGGRYLFWSMLGGGFENSRTPEKVT
jgi:hypothetical protein